MNTSEKPSADFREGPRSEAPESNPSPARIVVYRYGCLSPRDMGDDIVKHAEMQAALYARVAKINIAARRDYNTAISADPAVAAIEAEIAVLIAEPAEIDKAVAARSATARRVAQQTEAEASRLDAIRGALRELYVSLKAETLRVRREKASALRAIEERRRVDVKLARQDAAKAGLWWPNYNTVLARADAAYARAVKTGAELRIREWRGGDRWPGERDFREPLTFTFQVQGGMSVDEMFSGQMRQFGIDRPDPDAWTHPSRGERHRRQRTTARIAIYPTEGGGYRLLDVPVLLHRPIPDEARIKSATLQRARQGALWRWHLSLTCELPAATPREPRADRACGIDFGWRRRPGGSLRTAIVSWGEEYEEIALPPDWMDEFDRAEAWQGELDAEARVTLEWLRTATLGEVPDELRQHIADVVGNRLSGATALGRLTAWWSRTYPGHSSGHLARLQAWSRDDLRDRAARVNWVARLVRRRRELYRLAAARIAIQASVVGIDATALTDAARRPGATERDTVKYAARSQRVRAAVSVLRNELLRACAAAGVPIISCTGATNVCHICGAAPRPSSPADVTWKCQSCGTVYDQDINAARTIRRRALNAVVPTEIRGPLERDGKPKTGRFSRLRAPRGGRHRSPLEKASA
ncbi:MAG TPA: zinc ribbon domain-containing protein [Acetobacteraceae bacterium]|nr:zinc ribbon domain-containing protein [Acetobacteraceae bacterium]